MGTSVAGVVKRSFTSNDRPAYTLELLKPVTVNGKEVKLVSIGGLKGFEMSLQAAGLEKLQIGDRVHLESTGVTPSEEKEHSDMINFAIEVTRNGKQYKGRTEDAQSPFLGASFWQ